MTSIDDKVLMKFSVGIGHNIAESQEMLKIAKSNKMLGNHYNISCYNDNNGTRSLPYIHKSNELIDGYIRLEQKLHNDIDALRDLERMKYDPLTGLLNKTGYAIEVQKLIQNGMYDDRVIIFMDGDGLHELNEKLGYAKVDEILTRCGRALTDTSRHHHNNNGFYNTDKKARNIDVLNHRVNDSGSDEFIIDINCPYEFGINVAKRYIDSMYKSQLED